MQLFFISRLPGPRTNCLKVILVTSRCQDLRISSNGLEELAVERAIYRRDFQTFLSESGESTKGKVNSECNKHVAIML